MTIESILLDTGGKRERGKSPSGSPMIKLRCAYVCVWVCVHTRECVCICAHAHLQSHAQDRTTFLILFDRNCNKEPQEKDSLVLSLSSGAEKLKLQPHI